MRDEVAPVFATMRDYVYLDVFRVPGNREPDGRLSAVVPMGAKLKFFAPNRFPYQVHRPDIC